MIPVDEIRPLCHAILVAPVLGTKKDQCQHHKHTESPKSCSPVATPAMSNR